MKNRASFSALASGLVVLVIVLIAVDKPSSERGVNVEVVVSEEVILPGEQGVAALEEVGGLRVKKGRREVMEAVEAFRDWMGTGMETTELGVVLARERRKAMSWLIRNDPEAALEMAAGYEDRKRLPEEIVALLEEPVSDGGEFEWLMACPMEDGSGADVGESRWITLAEDGRRLEAFVFGRRLEVGTKDRISAHGIALDGAAALAETPIRRMGREEAEDVFGDARGGVAAEVFGEPVLFNDGADVRAQELELEALEDTLGPAPAESPWTEGPKRILYIRVRFSDDAADAEPLSLASAESRQGDVEEFFRITSYGKVTVETEITDVVTLPGTHSSYSGQGLGRMMDDARAQARVLGEQAGKDWDYNNYEFYTVVSRGGIGGYAGIAQVGGRKAHLQSTSLRTAGHEYGHNFGLGHAYYNYTASLRPTGQVSVHGRRPAIEYGHRFSIQSAQSGSDFNNPALPQFTSHEKNRLDWLGDSDFVDIESSGDSGLYRVFRNDHVDATGVQALRLRARGEGTNNRRYWVSYRAAWAPPTRSSENSYLTHGAVIDWTRVSGSYSTQLDPTPYSDDGSHRSSSTWTRDNDDKWDAALVIGRTFSDSETGVHVTPMGRGGSSPSEYLDVYVHVEGEREEMWISEMASCRAVVPNAGTVAGTEWTAPGYDDSGWPSSGPLGVGYENRSGYREFIGTDVGLAMSGVRGSCYIRVPFQVGDPEAISQLAGLKLRLRYDDGFIAYLNGVRVGSDHAPSNPGWNSVATDGHSDSAADDFVDFEIGAAGIASLVAGANVLAIHGLNDGTGSSDFLIQPQLVARYATEENRPPRVAITADRNVTTRDGDVLLTATAIDPDGDALAYAWHFGEGDAFAPEGLNSPTATKAWGSEGSYVVQVTVSDRKGGVTRDQLVIKVGDGGDVGQVRGRVYAGGLPVAGVRVWSGETQTFSADDGSYVLAGLGQGSHDIQAMADGEVFGATVDMPLRVEESVGGVDFWAFGSDEGLQQGRLTVSPAEANVEKGGAIPLEAWWWTDRTPELLVGFGEPGWRYLDDGSDQGSAWRGVGFDDSSWSVGGAPLGYGETGLGTEVGSGGSSSDRHITTYFRRDVTISDVGELSRVRMRVRRDDAVVVYVNGSEVLRDNIRPNDSVTASREAFNEVSGTSESEILVLNVPVDYFVEGRNVIAAEVHQEDGSSGDLYFDLELSGRRNVVAAAAASWVVVPGSGASVDTEGRFLATQAGEYSVTAQSEGQEATAHLTVTGDVEVSLTALDPVAMEWNESGGIFRLERSDASGELDVGLSFGGTADAGSDYGSLPSVVSFADGVTVVDLPVLAVDDTEPESFESVVVGLVADSSFRIGASGSGMVWIEDDDLDPAPSVSIVEPVADAGGSANATSGMPFGVAANVTDPELLVKRLSGWRFLDNGEPPAAGWAEIGFDDSGWREGLGKFGYGDGNERTALSFGDDAGAKHITTYFRKRFEVENVEEIDSISVRMLVDDGAVVYLNDNELLRHNMPEGVIFADTRAVDSVGGDDERAYIEFELPGIALAEGENVIAVEVHQRSPTSSDLGFDLEMEGQRFGVVTGVSLLWDIEGGDFSDAGAYMTSAVVGDAGVVVLSVRANDGRGGEGIDTISVEVDGPSYGAWAAASGIPVPLRGERDDADGDGVENLIEFALGMNGLEADPALPVDSVPGDAWQVQFVRRSGGSGEVGDYFVAGVRYRIWISDDGENWSLGGSRLSAAGSEIVGGGLERMTIEVEPDNGQKALFLRIEISN